LDEAISYKDRLKNNFVILKILVMASPIEMAELPAEIVRPIQETAFRLEVLGYLVERVV
jgi:hypothetical protein